MTPQTKEQAPKKIIPLLSVIISGVFLVVALSTLIAKTGQLSEQVSSSRDNINKLCQDKLDKEVFQQFIAERENRWKAIEQALLRMESKIDQHMNQK